MYSMSNAANTEIGTLREITSEIDYLEGLSETFCEDGDAGSASDVDAKIAELKKARDIYYGAGIDGGY